MEHLKRDLKRSVPGIIGVSTVTDPYQPIEREQEITRQALCIIGSAGYAASVQTKSSLVARDFDILRMHRFELGMTVTSMDDDFRRRFEPMASPPDERAATLVEAAALGIKTWIFYGPIIPGYNDSDSEMTALATLAERTRSSVLYDKINLKPLMRSRLEGVMTPQELQASNKVDFASVFNRFASICRGRGVIAKYAF